MTTGRMIARPCRAVVLAAGEGTRMRSSRPKVLHAIGGRTLIAHVLVAVGTTDGRTAVVVGPGQEAVVKAVKALVPDAEFYLQKERRGTAQGVVAAKAALLRGAQDVVVAFGDTPLITPQTIARLRGALAAGADVAVLGFRPADPTGYGRLVVDAGGGLLVIREENDGSPAERAIGLCNSGLMALAGNAAVAIPEQIREDNATRAVYLTPPVAGARAMGLAAVALETDAAEVRGVNTQSHLAAAPPALPPRLRAPGPR